MREQIRRSNIANVIEHLVLAEQPGIYRIWQAAADLRRGQAGWSGAVPHRGLSIEEVVERTWKVTNTGPISIRTAEQAPTWTIIVSKSRTSRKGLHMPDFLHRTYDLHQPEIASAFDEVSFWAARFGAFLFQHLTLRSNLTILDLACGTGFPLFELAQVYGPSCQVTGIDLWKEGVERARAKQQVYQFPNVQILEADAAHLPFGEHEFDLIVSNLGVNNFADPEAVLTECFRVAKPRASLVLTTNPSGHMRELYALFREVLLDLQKPMYLERLRRNEEHRGTKESLSGMLQAAGFHLVKIQEGAFQLRYVDGSALFYHVLTQVGFLEGWRQVVDPEDEEQVFALLETRLNQVAQARGELCLTVPMLYLEAEKLV